MLLAINSQNNPEDALEVVDSHQGMLLRRNDFAAMRINWQDKAANLVELSEELGLALDSFVFVDDNAAECERVETQALPEVWTVHLTGDPVTYAATLRGLGAFDVLSFGHEDQMRTAMPQRGGSSRSPGIVPSLEGFLESLEMQMDIEEVGPQNLPRAAEADTAHEQVQSHDPPLHTRRAAGLPRRPGHEGFVFRLRDRFGITASSASRSPNASRRRWRSTRCCSVAGS